MALFVGTSRADTVYDFALNSNNEIIVDKTLFTNQKKKQILIAHPNSQFPISLLDLGDDKYTALLMKCTHQKGTTEWVKNQYICPSHGARFSETGDVLRGPTTKNLKSYQVNVTGTEIIILLA